jgi:hypothetical protein
MSSFSDLRGHIEDAFEKAERGESKITQSIINMDGMTGTQTRQRLFVLTTGANSVHPEKSFWITSTAIEVRTKRNL